MKKLLTLLIAFSAVAAIAATAFAETETNALNDAINNKALRQVTVETWLADFPGNSAIGKAVIVGFNNNYTKVTLLTSESLATDIDTLDESGESLTYLAKITKGFIFSKAARVTIYAHNVNGHHYYKLTLPVALTGNSLHNAKVLKNISLADAVKLL